MITIEISLLIIAYTLLTVTIFLEIVCYKRNLETLEAIGLTVSLLMLVIALTVSHFLVQTKSSENTDVFTLLAMTLVAYTVPINTLVERQHKINLIWKKVLSICSALIFLLTVGGYYFSLLEYVQYIVAVFLSLAIVSSMLMIRFTKPLSSIAHREKTERIFAIAFMVLIPFSLFANHVAELENFSLKIGFTIPLIFILLSVNKLMDDMQRLSLFKTGNRVNEQNLINYSLTKREKEIANLLTKGKSYQQISDELFISMPTVKTHTSNIYRKCKVKTRSELTALLIQ